MDLTIVTVIVYRILLLIRGTRAMQMLTGLGIIGIAFFISSAFELFTTHWILSSFFDYLILIVIVLFQDDLRRALMNVGRNPFFYNTAETMEHLMISEVSHAAGLLARDRYGALIVLERETGLKNFTDTGSKLGSQIRSELIYSIFLPQSPIHDGAVIVSEGKITSAGCFLPLSKEPNIDKSFGTRHRAAIGISEETDAIVIVVSEELGQISLVAHGQITMNLTEDELKDQLQKIFELEEVPTRAITKKVGDWFSKRGIGKS